ncbi:MAG: DUF2608 domain-containing protein [Elusimicrobia bacterium]|nr:DUF2608 domain-containing protein [Elusimicrobiota bacterium]
MKRLRKNFAVMLAASVFLACAASARAANIPAPQRIIESATLAPVFEEAAKQLKEGKKPLVIFDIDNTLLYHAYYLGNEPWFGAVYDNYLTPLSKSDPARFVAEERAITWMTVILMLNTPSMLTEDGFTEQIRALQNRGVKMMAQTSRNVLVAEHTIGEMRHFGIDFSASSPFPETFDFVPWEGARPVICSSGAVFGQLQDKGRILLAFMAKSGYRPDSVIFADDSKKNIASVGAALKAADIPYIGVRYNKLDAMMEFYKKPEQLAAARAQLRSYYADGFIMPNEKAQALSKTAPVTVSQELKYLFGPQAEAAK